MGQFMLSEEQWFVNQKSTRPLWADTLGAVLFTNDEWIVKGRP
jgi:hypothetical protein